MLRKTEANLKERVERNKSEHRLKHKPSKRNVEFFEKELLDSNQNHRLNSNKGEISKPEYIKIDNTKLSPAIVAKMIKDKLDL